jgi:hypothetical protein
MLHFIMPTRANEIMTVAVHSYNSFVQSNAISQIIRKKSLEREKSRSGALTPFLPANNTLDF